MIDLFAAAITRRAKKGWVYVTADDAERAKFFLQRNYEPYNRPGLRRYWDQQLMRRAQQLMDGDV